MSNPSWLSILLRTPRSRIRHFKNQAAVKGFERPVNYAASSSLTFFVSGWPGSVGSLVGTSGSSGVADSVCALSSSKPSDAVSFASVSVSAGGK